MNKQDYEDTLKRIFIQNGADHIFASQEAEEAIELEVIAADSEDPNDWRVPEELANDIVKDW